MEARNNAQAGVFMMIEIRTKMQSLWLEVCSIFFKLCDVCLVKNLSMQMATARGCYLWEIRGIGADEFVYCG